MSKKYKYYYRVLTERNGEYEYDHKNVFMLPEDMDPQVHLKAYAQGFYGGEDGVEEDGWFHFFGGSVAVCPNRITEITKHDYDVMRRYL